jgi:hypothetical protein
MKDSFQARVTFVNQAAKNYNQFAGKNMILNLLKLTLVTNGKIVTHYQMTV